MENVESRQPEASRMDNQQIQEFLQAILQGKGPTPANALEQGVMEDFRKAHGNRETAEKHLVQAEKQTEEIKTAIQRAIGQAEALANILIKQEMDRKKPEVLSFEGAVANKKKS